MDLSKRQITKIAREANKLVILTMKEGGMGSGEVDLIHLIRHNPGLSQKEVSQKLNMDKGAVARRTANLEKKGYLHRVENPSDGRSRFIYATEKAEQLKNLKASIEALFYTWLLEELDDDEKTAFLQTLDKLYLHSKKESRSGFPHILQLLQKDEPDKDYE